jgi:hypothetical protein
MGENNISLETCCYPYTPSLIAPAKPVYNDQFGEGFDRGFFLLSFSGSDKVDIRIFWV